MYGNIRAVYGPNRVNLGWEIGLINFFALFLHPIEVVTEITLDHDTFNLYYISKVFTLMYLISCNVLIIENMY